MAGKSRVARHVDNGVLPALEARAESGGGNHRTMANEVLKQYALGLTAADMARQTIREEIRSARWGLGGSIRNALKPRRGASGDAQFEPVSLAHERHSAFRAGAGNVRTEFAIPAYAGIQRVFAEIRVEPGMTN